MYTVKNYKLLLHRHSVCNRKGLYHCIMERFHWSKKIYSIKAIRCNKNFKSSTVYSKNYYAFYVVIMYC